MATGPLRTRWQCQLSISMPSCAPIFSPTLHHWLPDLLVAEEVPLKQMQQELKETQSDTQKQSNAYAFLRQMMKGLSTKKAISHSLQASAPLLNFRLPWMLYPSIISREGLLFSQECLFTIETVLFCFSCIDLSGLEYSCVAKATHCSQNAPQTLSPPHCLCKATSVSRHRTSMQTFLTPKAQRSLYKGWLSPCPS